MYAPTGKPAVSDGVNADAADVGRPGLEDVLGEVIRSYPVSFYDDPGDEGVEREALDAEIFAGLVVV